MVALLCSVAVGLELCSATQGARVGADNSGAIYIHGLATPLPAAVGLLGVWRRTEQQLGESCVDLS